MHPTPFPHPAPFHSEHVRLTSNPKSTPQITVYRENAGERERDWLGVEQHPGRHAPLGTSLAHTRQSYMVHVRQSKLDSCLVFQVKVPDWFYGDLSSLGDRENAGEPERDWLGAEQNPGRRDPPGTNLEYGAHKTVKTRLWPCLPGKSPYLFSTCSKSLFF